MSRCGLLQERVDAGSSCSIFFFKRTKKQNSAEQRKHEQNTGKQGETNENRT